ncbi:hypothetical protein D3C73_1477390 [compost metagenome]
MHECPLRQSSTDLERFDPDRAALDVEFGSKLTGTHQRIVQPHQRHIGIQVRQVGGVFHVQVRHELAPGRGMERSYV